MTNLWARKSIAALRAEAEERDVQALTTHGGIPLKRTLSATSLVALGIGAIVGAGIFVLTGHAAAVNAGPAIGLSFVLSAIACAFRGPVLRRDGLDGADFRQCLHLCLRNDGRNCCLDHRLGLDPRICPGRDNGRDRTGVVVTILSGLLPMVWSANWSASGRCSLSPSCASACSPCGSRNRNCRARSRRRQSTSWRPPVPPRRCSSCSGCRSTPGYASSHGWRSASLSTRSTEAGTAGLDKQAFARPAHSGETNVSGRHPVAAGALVRGHRCRVPSPHVRGCNRVVADRLPQRAGRRREAL